MTQPKKLFHLSDVLTLEVTQDSEDFDHFNLKIIAEIGGVSACILKEFVLQHQFHYLGFLGMGASRQDTDVEIVEFGEDMIIRAALEDEASLTIRLTFPKVNFDEVRKWVDEQVAKSKSNGSNKRE